MKKDKMGHDLTKEDILIEINSLEGIVAEIVGDTIEGEYKDFGYKIDEDNNVIVSEKLKGDKPTAVAYVTTMTEGLEDVEIQVLASIRTGSIASIEPLNEITLKEEKSSREKIYTVKDNGEYRFRIRADNGRSIIVNCDVKNAIPTYDDILTAIEETEGSKTRKIQVNGRLVDGTQKREIYSLNIITHDGDLVLDGTLPVEGATLENLKYEFGSEEDVGTSGGYAKNTVVFKVVGNLEIQSGVTVTSVANSEGYGGPKGMIIYCTGTLTNNGTISMTARGGKAVRTKCIFA